MKSLIGAILALASCNLFAQNLSADTLEEIKNFAADICEEVSQEGSFNKYTISGKLGAKASGLSKILGISLDAGGDLTKTGQKYVGVAHDSLPEQLKDVRACKKELAIILIKSAKSISHDKDSLQEVPRAFEAQPLYPGEPKEITDAVNHFIKLGDFVQRVAEEGIVGRSYKKTISELNYHAYLHQEYTDNNNNRLCRKILLNAPKNDLLNPKGSVNHELCRHQSGMYSGQWRSVPQ